MSIYILKLENNKYYVGKTLNFEQRYKDHLNGTGCAWTQINKPIDNIQKIPCKDKFHEMEETLLMMIKHGIHNVRGGPWTSVHLSVEQIKTINDIICTIEEKCFICHVAGHYANICPHKKSFKKDEEEFYEEDEEEEEFYEEIPKIYCFKCKKMGHVKSMCKFS